jgi:hydroxymethylpyrimidine pyrophosphatase-like HAD family hydrolase
MPVQTLRQFYELMHSTVPVRRALTREILASRRATAEAVGHLREALAGLEAIPEEPAGRRLTLEGSRAIHVDLTYEIEELKKDLVFLEHGEEALLEDLAERHVGFREELARGVDALRGLSFQAFVTDRDGTVNNYCGRYASSVQSTYNAVFLTRFARARARGSVVLTSAPLDDIGLADMAVTPPGALICAGSKGREYFDADGRRHQYPIEPEKQGRLDALNEALAGLLKTDGNDVFTLIGSGLQQKFGQTTIARQDIGGSIPEERSKRFMDAVRELVRSVDPEGTFFRIEDTGLDLEILLTVDDEAGGTVRDFDKGDGVRFLNEDLGLAMGRGACLVCGDTGSDVPMLAATRDLAPETRAVFVTRKEELRQKAKEVLLQTLFVGEPDTLVAILNALGKA